MNSKAFEDMMRYTKYYWLHFPTGERGESVFDGIALPAGHHEGLSHASALARVNHWNSLPGDYRYWIA